MTKNNLIAVAAMAAFGEWAVGAAAVADEPSQGPSNALEEIVVTARMRKESLQNVPMSVTAFSVKAIEDAGIENVGDFIGLVPNVSLVQTQSTGTSFMTIRGITQVRNGEPPVAVVVDGVQQISDRQFTQELFDIERIEVLRGPQGALYGRNATGGAIIVTTRQPSNELRGHLRGGYGSGEERLIEASLSGPLVHDTLLFRAGARYLDREGYFNNINLGKKVDPLEDLTVRTLLQWNASERLTLGLRANILRADSGALNHGYQPALIGPDGVTLDPNNPFPFDFTRGDANLVDRNFKATNIGEGRRDIDEVSLKIDYDAVAATLTSITSWNQVTESITGDQFPYTASLTRSFFNGTFVVDGTQTQFVDVGAWSQELRLTSRADRRLRWMGGLYYLDTSRFISTTTGDDRGQGIVAIERTPRFSDPRNPTLSFFADDNDNEAWAAFGNVAYDITARLEAAIALRYDEDQRQQRVSPLNTGGVPGALNERSFSKFQPKGSLRYQPTADLNFYGSWGVGFRSGQFNQNGVGVAAAAAGIVGVEDSVDQEETETLEAGFKSEWLDDRLRISGGVFRTNVDGQHYFVFVGQVGAQVLVSIDEVKLTGGEIEAIANLAPGLDAYLAWGVTSSEIESYGLSPADVGNDAPYVPRSTLNLGAQYRRPITGQLGLFGRIDYERRGEQFWDPENSTARSAIDLVNLRLGVEADRWSLIGAVDNATNTVYNSEWVLGGFPHVAPPRTWRVDLRINL